MLKISQLYLQIKSIRLSNMSLRSVHYYVSKTDALSSSAEGALLNPLLKKNWAKPTAGINQLFQHPYIGRGICCNPNCSGIFCLGFCNKIIKKEFVGHVTHSNYPGSVFISYQDFSLAFRIQHYVFYKTPVPDYDFSGSLIDPNKTKVLQTLENGGVVFLIHAYSIKITITHDFI